MLTFLRGGGIFMFVAKCILLIIKCATLTIALGQITSLCMFISLVALDSISVRIWICLWTFNDLCPKNLRKNHLGLYSTSQQMMFILGKSKRSIF